MCPIPATTGQLRTKIKDMEIGDYIICKYVATYNTVGTFSELGTTTATEIPITGAVAPNGSFYFVKVAKGLLVADRVVQHSISWDKLNIGKVIQGMPWNNGNIIPNMTSNISPSGGVANSNFKSGSMAYKCFDGVNDWGFYPSALPVWVSYQFPAPTVIHAYAVSVYFTSNRPESFTFEGSNDSVNWTVLDSQFNLTDSWWGSSSVKKFFYIQNKTAYTYYRINVTASTNTSGMNIGELEMMDTAGVIRSLTGGVTYADANGNKSTTDQGTGKAFPNNSEFDKYVLGFNQTGVRSGKTLFDVFHHDAVKTWTQDTPSIAISASTNRVTRGGTTGTNNFSYLASSTANNTVGFRPVFEFIE